PTRRSSNLRTRSGRTPSTPSGSTWRKPAPAQPQSDGSRTSSGSLLSQGLACSLRMLVQHAAWVRCLSTLLRYAALVGCLVPLLRHAVWVRCSGALCCSAALFCCSALLLSFSDASCGPAGLSEGLFQLGQEDRP